MDGDDWMDERAYAMFATIFPHEAYDDDPDKFWEFFHSKCPTVSRWQMIETLDKTRSVLRDQNY